VAQVVELKALSSNPSTIKKEKEKREKTFYDLFIKISDI
jgi:hypothetical protein